MKIPGLLSVRGTICKEDLEPNSDSRLGLESFSVSSTNVVHPLALFNAETQQRKLIFRTNGDPLMSRAECSSVIDIVEEYHKNILGGKWGTVRKSSVKTTDVAVEDIPVLRPWLLALLHTKLFPLLSLAFPILIDGTTLYDTKTQISRLRVHDAFIVRYDAVNDLSLSLPEHCDTSSMSVIFALNEEERNHIEQDQDDQSQEQNQYEEKRQTHGTYKGGGTWFESLGVQGQVINADIGQAVMFAGPLKHAGYPISAGIRNILVLFLYVEGFHYGPYLQKSRSKVPLLEKVECSEDTLEKKRTSGAETGGFVVYRQTVELVSMLNEVTDRDCLDV